MYHLNRNGRVLKSVGVILVVMLGFSCKKFLDEKPDKRLVTPTTLADLQALLDDATIMNIEKTSSSIEVSADDYFYPFANYNALETEEQGQYRWQQIDYNYVNDWSNGYRPVYNSNLCLELLGEINKGEVDAAKWDNVKGSALFYRAYYFLNLVWAFSKVYNGQTMDKDLGIILRLVSDYNVPSVRASVKASYERILSEASESVKYLPDLPQHAYRPSKAAAYGLLARTYLSMGKYDSTYKYANLCLQLKRDLMDYNSDPSIAGLTSGTPFAKFNSETIFYSEMNSQYGAIAAFRGRVDSVLYASYATGNLRKIGFFLAAAPYQRFKGSYSKNQTLWFSGIATDEMFLTRAECYARMDNKDGALGDLNTLLKKRWATGAFVPLDANTAAEALQLVLLERRKELLFRGLRWIDIKRLNRDGAKLTLKRVINGVAYTLPPDDNRYALPLPKDIIDLTGMPQNPQ